MISFEMVAEADLCGGGNFGGYIFHNENSRLAKVHDLVSGYLEIKCREME